MALQRTTAPSEPHKPESITIGIDQSYTGFGFVVLDETGHCHQKTLRKYELKKFDGEADRLSHIYTDLVCFLAYAQSLSPTVKVFMEGYAYGAKLNREKLGELGGVVKLATRHVLYSEPTSVPPTTLKQFATGSGRATKEQMVKAAQEFDAEITNDNLADAYLLALYGTEA
jgi:Holliday junction resolvasome RuvABC endonuclease subunit